ncbi:MAG: hypothetical protein IKQ77_14495 [Prevotella sp.]|nr:hypothetical protein [Prevotella sp.]
MMRTLKAILLAAFCMLGATMLAQQNLNWGQGEQVVSPEVNANKTVTFRMVAAMEDTSGEIGAYTSRSSHHCCSNNQIHVIQ